MHEGDVLLPTFDRLRASLRASLREPLPGPRFQGAMAPSWRRDTLDPSAAARGGFRRASVLILLYPRNGELFFPLIVRSGGAGPHAGQIAFPGGAVEGSESDEEAALRESWEEMGTDPFRIEVCGALTPFAVSVSRYLVTPIVAVTAEVPDFRPNPVEVADWFPVAAESLLDARSLGTAAIPYEGGERSVPCFRFEGRVVWGATAIALAEFAELLRRCLV